MELIHGVRIHGVYRHYKGGWYKVLGVVRDSENCKNILVHYKQLKKTDFDVGTEWVRPLNMFLETLSDGKKRFELIGIDL